MTKTIKMIILAFAMIFTAFIGINVNAAANNTVRDEAAIEEGTPLEEGTPGTDEILKEEETNFMDELNITLATIFAWIGGLGGGSAVLLFILRFIKDKHIMSSIREDIAAMKAKNDEVADGNANQSETAAMLEKVVLVLIENSNTDAATKAQIMKELEDKSINIKDAIKTSKARVTKQVESNAAKVTEITNKAETWLQRLAKED